MKPFRKEGSAATTEQAGKVSTGGDFQRNGENQMTKKLDTVKSLLESLDFPPKAIHAGIAALSEQPVATAQPEPLLTPRQLCEYLRISPTSLWRLGPPCLRVGARKRYLLSEVLEFMHHRKAERGAA